MLSLESVALITYITVKALSCEAKRDPHHFTKTQNMSLLSSVTEPIWSARTFLLIGEIDSLRSVLCAVSMLCSLIVVGATQEEFRRGFSPVSPEEGCEEPSGGLTQW